MGKNQSQLFNSSFKFVVLKMLHFIEEEYHILMLIFHFICMKLFKGEEFGLEIKCTDDVRALVSWK